MKNELLFPLDLTGTQPSNRITNEKHTVSPPSQITQSAFIVLRNCPAFAHSIVVRDGTGPSARTLVRGEDYILTHKSIALSLLCKKQVYASIMFNDRNYTGTLYINYQTVGGEYTLPDYTMVEKLTRQKYTIKNVSFDQIVGLPASYPNPPHQHDPEDMVGLGQVVDKLKDIAAALRSMKGSYGVLDETVKHHLNSSVAHTPDKVGLGNVKNFTIASLADYAARAPDKYTTADTVFDHVNTMIEGVKGESASRYLTKIEAQNSFVTSQTTYNKTEVNNLFYTRSHTDATYLKKSEALTTAQVGNIINTMVDFSQYYTRTETQATYYTKALSDTRYYTKTQTDNLFVTQSQADLRYVQTTDSEKIISPREGNQLRIEDGKFYVGNSASGDVVELYIDAIDGSDNGTGTRSSPLRTLARANEMTPPDKSSTWYLRWLSVHQLVTANSFYTWDFDHTVSNNAKRTITIYRHSWIDSSKYQQATQLADGKIHWQYLAQVARVPIKLRSYKNTGNNEQFLYQAIVDTGTLELNGIELFKPRPIDSKAAPVKEYTRSAFIRGQGTFINNGVFFTQEGDYQTPDTTSFHWWALQTEDDLKIVLNHCSYGYGNFVLTNSVNTISRVHTTAFNYPKVEDRPFQMRNTVAKLIVNQVTDIGAGAVAAGATVLYQNCPLVLTRANMFTGLNLVNGVCTNVLTNLTLNSTQ